MTTLYNVVGGKVTWEKTGSNNPIYYSYDASGSLWGMQYNGSMYFYVRNAQGDIIKIINSSGTVVVEYAYDAWGKLMSTTGSLASTLGVDNPYRYRGYRFDTETGLYYLQSRYYNPQWGRFVNADGLIGKTGGLLTHNLYIYCSNNPITHVDFNGDFFFTVIGGFIGGVVGAIDAAIHDEDVLAGAIGGAITGALMGAATDITVATCGAGGIVGVAIIYAACGAAGGAAGNFVQQTVTKTNSGASFNQAISDINYSEVRLSAEVGMVSSLIGMGVSYALANTIMEPVKQTIVNNANRYVYGEIANFSHGNIIKIATIVAATDTFIVGSAISTAQSVTYRILNRRMSGSSNSYYFGTRRGYSR